MSLCRECGKIFASQGKQLDMCPDCTDREEEAFSLLKQYIEGHPQSSLISVVSDTGIPLKTVQKFVSSGRLNIRSSF